MREDILRLREFYGRRVPPMCLHMLLALGTRRRLVAWEDVEARMEETLGRELGDYARNSVLKRLRRAIPEAHIETHYCIGLQLHDAPHLEALADRSWPPIRSVR